MLLFTDGEGRYVGHTDAEYPAPAEMIERVRAEQTEGHVLDVPPFDTRFWYFPKGVPAIRPQLDYSVTEKQDGDDKVTVVSGIPKGLSVQVLGPDGGQVVEADGDDLELVLRTPGSYSVTFDPFPHQPVAVHIAVTKEG